MTQYTVSGYTHSLLECENKFLRACIDEQDRIITSYQIAKDNLELRLAKMCLDIPIPDYIAAPPPAQVY